MALVLIKIVEQGIEVLVRLLHRGGVGGDVNTGDGAGILLQIPFQFFNKASADASIILPESGKYAVGMPPRNMGKHNAML